MGRRDALIAEYARALKTKCHITPDMDLLTRVTIGCGPAIYDGDAATIADDPAAFEGVKTHFLINKLGLSDGPALMDAIDAAIATYGSAERTKYRAVIYYMLVKHFGKEAVYR